MIKKIVFLCIVTIQQIAEALGMKVASGSCVRCGYDGHELLKDDKVNP